MRTQPIFAHGLAALLLLHVAVPVLCEESKPPRGAQLLLPFKQQLQGALSKGLSDSVPAAIDTCQLEAPDIALAASQHGVRVGRSSHRLRNPENAPPDWVRPIQAQYLEHPDQRTPQTVPLTAQTTGYVEPIVLQPLCLACHGERIDAAVQARLDALYPADRATGFAVGDLRGVFWVEYPNEGAQAGH